MNSQDSKPDGNLVRFVREGETIAARVRLSDWLLLIVRGGVGNLTWTAETIAAFWFLTFSWPAWVLGYVVNWAHRNTGRLPPFLGWWIFIVPALSLVFLPASGLWLFAIFGALVMVMRRRERRAA